MKRFICIILVSVLCVVLCSCGKTKDYNISETEKTESQSNYEIIGTGSKEFIFTVIGTDEKSITYSIKTDKQTVAEALIENNLIIGKQGTLGYVINTVNGEELNYQKDGSYWAFLINNEYAATTIDNTIIIDDTEYILKAEKDETFKPSEAVDKYYTLTNSDKKAICNYIQDRYDYYDGVNGGYAGDKYSDTIMQEAAKKYGITGEQAYIIWMNMYSY